MKAIKNPYIEILKNGIREESMQEGMQKGSKRHSKRYEKKGREEGRKEGIQFGINLLSKMIRNKQLDREQSEEYLRDLGLDQEAID